MGYNCCTSHSRGRVRVVRIARIAKIVKDRTICSLDSVIV